MWKCAKNLGSAYFIFKLRTDSSSLNSTSSCLSSPPAYSHHLQRKSLQFMRQECHAPCKRDLGPNLTRPASQWPSYDSLNVRRHYQGPSKLAGSLGGDAARRSGKGTPHRRLRWHGRVERSLGWLKKLQKLNPIGGRGRGRPKKTWTAVIDMDCLALGLTETHPTDRKAWSGRCAVRLDTPLY